MMHTSITMVVKVQVYQCISSVLKLTLIDISGSSNVETNTKVKLVVAVFNIFLYIK